MTPPGSPIGERRYGGRSADERASDRLGRLLAAALDLFGEHGYAATSIEQLCSRAGVSTRSFYHDVGSREALLRLLVTRLNSEGGLACAEVLAEENDDSVVDRMAAAIRAYLSVTCSTRRHARVCYVEIVGVSTDIELWRQRARESIVQMFGAEGRRAVERGEIAPRNFRLLIVAVIGAANLLAQEWAMSDVAASDTAEGADFRPFLDEIVALASASLRA